MTAPPRDIAAPSSPPEGRIAWRRAWLLAGGILLLRALYLVLLCPYELAGDEAHYWDWSRNLSLSYYTKGPGVAWIIAAGRSVFGEAEWAIRLPAAICSSLTMLALAGMAASITRRPAAAPWAVALAALMPPFTAAAQFMTIDAPFLTCWTLAAWAGYHTWRAPTPSRRLAAWALCGLALGIGFDCKYTILLLAPGIALQFLLVRRDLLRRPDPYLGLALCVAVFLLAVSPVIVWNMQQDPSWPTLAHQYGHMKVEGADIDVDDGGYEPIWTLEYIAGQLGAVGPPMLALFGLAAVRGLRLPRRRPAEIDADGDGASNPDAAGKTKPDIDRDDAIYLLLCGGFTLLFLLAFSFRTDIEVNWAMPAYITPIVLVAAFLGGEMACYRDKVRKWQATAEPRPKLGWLRRKPETPWQVAWHWTIGWGVAAAAIIMLAGHLTLVLPESGAPLTTEAFRRVHGHHARAADVHAARLAASRAAGDDLLLAADHYMDTSLLAYYLPGRPTVYCGASRLGSRVNAYDFFPATDWTDPAIRGRPFLLVGARADRWGRAFRFEAIQQLGDDPKLLLGLGYQGPRRAAELNRNAAVPADRRQPPGEAP